MLRAKIKDENVAEGSAERIVAVAEAEPPEMPAQQPAASAHTTARNQTGSSAHPRAGRATTPGSKVPHGCP